MVDLEEIQRKCFSNNTYDREDAAILLKNNFESLDKIQAWECLHRLVRDRKINVRIEAAKAMRNVFQYLLNEQQAWEDLNRLILDTEPDVSKVAIETLGIAFEFSPDLKKSSEILHKLILKKDIDSLEKAIEALGIAFNYLLDKKTAWEDLHNLTISDEKTSRSRAVGALGNAYQYIPYKQQALEDLHRLTNDVDRSVRWRSAEALKIAFRYIPDKQQALEDIHRLTYDEDSSVRWKAAEAIGTVFQQMPDKEQAWRDLHKLILDEEILVRLAANHSLGRIYIYKASQSESEEEYLEELKKAIEFFENVAKESTWFNPSKFCFPFYRSFYTIISAKKQESRDEIAKYLSEAKNAIEGSENKKLLFEAVENLANALKEVQNLENMDLEVKKGELNFYSKYCEQAAELMKDTEKTAPYATIVVRKGLPSLNRKLKTLLKEIQEKAKVACWKSQGTPTQEIACDVSREVQKWELGSQEEMTWNVENLIFALESSVPRLPANQHIFDRIQQIREQKDISKQYGIVSVLIPLIPKLCMEQKIDSMEKKLDDIIIHFSESHTDITISLGVDVYGNGMKVTKTIPLQKFSENEKGEIEGKIQGNKEIKLSSLSATLVNKIKGHLF